MDTQDLTVPLPRRRFLSQALTSAGGCSLIPRIARGQDPATTVHRDLAMAMESAELSQQFRGTTAVECRRWQKEFRTRLTGLLGDSTSPVKWTIVESSREKLKLYTRFDLLLKASGVPSLPVYLLVPHGLGTRRRAPGVLCVHGHGPYGNDAVVGRRDLDGAADHIDKLNYDFGHQFAERGYVVVAPCMIPFGRRVNRENYGGNDPCAVTFVRMQALGKLPITANLRDLRWAIDLLQSRPEVETAAIGCAGLSYGGRMAMLVSAVDTRIQIASVSGALNLMQERMTLRHSCGSQMIPGLLKYGDYSEIGSLIAPRPCVWETGSKDSLIVPVWDELFRERLRRVYKALDVAEMLHFDRFEGGHAWSGHLAYPLFDEVLRS